MRIGAVHETVTVSGASPLVDVQNVLQQKVVSERAARRRCRAVRRAWPCCSTSPRFQCDARRRRLPRRLPVKLHQRVIPRQDKPQQDDVRRDADQRPRRNESVRLFPRVSGGRRDHARDRRRFGGERRGRRSGELHSQRGRKCVSRQPLGSFLRQSHAKRQLDRRSPCQGRDDSAQGVSARGITGPPLAVRSCKDRLWFHTTHRWLGIDNQMAGVFFNKTQGTPFYTPDPDRPGTRDEHFRSNSVPADVAGDAASTRSTAGPTCRRTERSFFSPNTAPEALNLFDFSPRGPVPGDVELAGDRAGCCSTPARRSRFSIGLFGPATGREPQTTFPSSTCRTGSATTPCPFLYWRTEDREPVRATILRLLRHRVACLQDRYLRGRGSPRQGIEVNGDVSYQFLGVTPASVQQYATPYRQKEIQKADLGIFVRDQWTVGRLTLNLGLRVRLPEHVRARTACRRGTMGARAQISRPSTTSPPGRT